jgi:hypothetical protein
MLGKTKPWTTQAMVTALDRLADYFDIRQGWVAAMTA